MEFLVICGLAQTSLVFAESCSLHLRSFLILQALLSFAVFLHSDGCNGCMSLVSGDTTACKRAHSPQSHAHERPRTAYFLFSSSSHSDAKH